MLPRRAALAALLVLPLAACGSPTRATANPEIATRHPDPTVNPTVFPSKTPSPTPAATGATTGGPTGGTTPPAAEPGAIAALASNVFEPKTTTVKVGTKVTWTNKGGFHTVTGGEPGKPDSASPMQGTLASDGATYEVTFSKAGTYKYFCQPHATVGMVGEVIVQ